ncbi:unnamed protein product [Urochloa humidicola]
MGLHLLSLSSLRGSASSTVDAPPHQHTRRSYGVCAGAAQGSHDEEGEQQQYCGAPLHSCGNSRGAQCAGTAGNAPTAGVAVDMHNATTPHPVTARENASKGKVLIEWLVISDL